MRKESFGLLFYDSRTTNLTLIKSGSLLDIDRDSVGNTVIKMNEQAGSGNTKTRRVLRTLVAKGLLCDTPGL